MRVRISTTIDGEKLQIAREKSGLSGSKLFDEALRALLEELDREDARTLSDPTATSSGAT
jgi:hypothetical protein